MTKRPKFVTDTVLSLLYVAVIIGIVQLNETFTAVQVVTIGAVHLVVNTIYAAYKKQLTYSRFMEYGSITILVTILAWMFLT